MFVFLDFRDMISDLGEQVSLVGNFEPALGVANRITSYKFDIFSKIFTICSIFFLIIFVTLGFTFLYGKFKIMYLQFLDFSASLYLILSLLELRMPDYQTMKEKIDERIASYKGNLPYHSFFKKPPIERKRKHLKKKI